MRIHRRHLLAVLRAQYQIFGVEHVQHGEQAVAVHFVETASTVNDGLLCGAHLGLNMCLDKFLIAA